MKFSELPASSTCVPNYSFLLVLMWKGPIFKTEFLALDRRSTYINKSENCDHLAGSGVDILNLGNDERDVQVQP